MKQTCAIHGEVEFLPPDQNFKSYCSLCWKESYKKWCKDNGLAPLEKIAAGAHTKCSMGATVKKPTCFICSEFVHVEDIHATLAFQPKLTKG